MAKKVNKSELELTGRNTSAVNAIKGVTKELGTAEKAAGGFGKGIGGTIGSIGSMFTSLPLAAAAAGIGVAGFVKTGVDKFREFEKGLRNVNTIINVSEAELDAIGEKVLEMAGKYGKSSTDLTAALYQTTSAGIAAGDSVEFLDAAAKASIAGLSTVEESVGVLTTVLNSYNMETSEAGKVSDILFQTVAKGVTTFPELSASLSAVTSLAAASGIEFEQLAAMIATLTKGGAPTSEAVTRIRAAILAMNDTLGDGWADTMTLQEGFAAMREEAKGSVSELRNLTGRAEGTLGILAATGDNAQRAADDLTAMAEAVGATHTAYGEQEKSLDFKLNRLYETSGTLAIKLGEVLVPALVSMADFLVDDFIPAINDGKGAMEDWLEDDTLWGGKATNDLAMWLMNTPIRTLGYWTDLYDYLRSNSDAAAEEIEKFLGFERIPKTKENFSNIKESFTDIYLSTDSLTYALVNGFTEANLVIDETTEKTNELGNSQNELTEELRKEWDRVAASLSSEKALAGLKGTALEFAKIDQKVEDLYKKFGKKDIIEEWANTMKNALIKANDIDVDTKPSLPDNYAHLFNQQLADQNKTLHEAQKAEISNVTNYELANLALRQQATQDMFTDMSQAAYLFYQNSGQQSKAAFTLYKSFAIAEASISTYNAAIDAYKSLVGIPVIGPTLAAAAAGAAVTFGMAQIANIASMQPNGRANGIGTAGVTSIPTTNNNTYNRTENAQQITININSTYQDPDAIARDLVPAIKRAINDGV